MAIREFLSNPSPVFLVYMATREQGQTLAPSTTTRAVDFCYCHFECTYEEPTFADVGGIDAHNDFTSFLFAKKIPTDTITFKLFKNGVEVATLSDDTYGQFFDIGDLTVSDNPDAALYTGYRIDWENVLDLLGPGKYQFKADTIITGLAQTIESHIFRLMQYSDLAANNTIRIKTLQNGNIVSNPLNYTNLFWIQSIRICGKLYNRRPQFETDNYLDSQLKKQQIQDNIINRYTLETRLLPNNISNKIIYDLFLSNRIQVTDYNIWNEDVENCAKTYNEVELYPDEFADPPVFSKSTQRTYEFEFVEKNQNTRKRNF